MAKAKASTRGKKTKTPEKKKEKNVSEINEINPVHIRIVKNQILNHLTRNTFPEPVNMEEQIRFAFNFLFKPRNK